MAYGLTHVRVAVKVWTLAYTLCLAAAVGSNAKPNVIIMLMDDVSMQQFRENICAQVFFNSRVILARSIQLYCYIVFIYICANDSFMFQVG